MGMAKLKLLLHLNRWNPSKGPGNKVSSQPNMSKKAMYPEEILQLPAEVKSTLEVVVTRDVVSNDEITVLQADVVDLDLHRVLSSRTTDMCSVKSIHDIIVNEDISNDEVSVVVESLKAEAVDLDFQQVLSPRASDTGAETALYFKEQTDLPPEGDVSSTSDVSYSGNSCVIYPSVNCNDVFDNRDAGHGLPDHRSDPGVYYEEGCESQKPTELVQNSVDVGGGCSCEEKVNSSDVECSEVKRLTSPGTTASPEWKAKSVNCDVKASTEIVAVLPGSFSFPDLRAVSSTVGEKAKDGEVYLVRSTLFNLPDKSMTRVSDWVSKIDLECLIPEDVEGDNVLDETETPISPPADIRIRSSIFSEKNLAPGQISPLKEDRNLEIMSSGAAANALVNVDVEYANRCTRTVDRNAISVNFVSVGLKVAPSMTSFCQLKSLSLSHNSIGRLQSGTFPRTLHVLDLSHNRLTSIEGLRDLTRLRILNVSHNRISRIGHGLASCSSVRELYLASNRISEVEGLHRLLKLSVLDLGANKLTGTKALSQLAANYGSLRTLNLANNPIHVNLGEDAFRRYVSGLLPHLVYLNNSPVKTMSSRELVGEGGRSSGLPATGRNTHASSSSRGYTGSKKTSTGGHQRYSSVGRREGVSGEGSGRYSGTGKI